MVYYVWYVVVIIGFVSNSGWFSVQIVEVIKCNLVCRMLNWVINSAAIVKSFLARERQIFPSVTNLCGYISKIMGINVLRFYA